MKMCIEQLDLRYTFKKKKASGKRDKEKNGKKEEKKEMIDLVIGILGDRGLPKKAGRES
jgi:hypothetical protein